MANNAAQIRRKVQSAAKPPLPVEPEEKYVFQTVVIWRLMIVTVINVLVISTALFFFKFLYLDQVLKINLSLAILFGFVSLIPYGVFFTLTMKLQERFCLRNKEEVTISDAGIKSLRHGDLRFSEMRNYVTHSVRKTWLTIWHKDKAITFTQSLFETDAFEQFIEAFERRVTAYNATHRENPIEEGNSEFRKGWVKTLALLMIPLLMLVLVIAPARVIVHVPLVLMLIAEIFSEKNQRR